MSVVVLDFGSQYTRLIARRIRELNAFSVILPGTVSIERIRQAQPEAIILSGSPKSVFELDAPKPDTGIYGLGIPILGICYGMQLLAEQHGGRIADAGNRSYGADVLHEVRGPMFEGLACELCVWMSHASSVEAPPPGWVSIAATQTNPYAAIASPDMRYVGVQFHPEVVHTPHGAAMLSSFMTAAGVVRDWTAQQNADRLVKNVRDQVGQDSVLLGISGGVDSSALALLLAKAEVTHHAVFVDHGLLRMGEREEVENALRPLGVNLTTINASAQFFAALSGISDPEAKRKTIGREFEDIDVQKLHGLGHAGS